MSKKYNALATIHVEIEFTDNGRDSLTDQAHSAIKEEFMDGIIVRVEYEEVDSGE